MASPNDFMTRLATDDNLREELKANPEETLRREGAQIPEGTTVEVVESTSEKIYFVMPPRAEQGAEGELSDEQLAGAPGGGGSIPSLDCHTQTFTCPSGCTP